MKRIFEKDLPAFATAIDHGQQIIVTFATTPISTYYGISNGATHSYGAYTKKDVRKLKAIWLFRRARFFGVVLALLLLTYLASIKVNLSIFSDGFGGITFAAVPLQNILLFIGVSIFLVSISKGIYPEFEKKMRWSYHKHSTDRYQSKLVFDVAEKTVTRDDSDLSGLFYPTEYWRVGFSKYIPESSEPKPIDETSVFVISAGVIYRHGLRQSQIGFEVPVAPPKSFPTEGELQPRIVAVLNEILKMVRERPAVSKDEAAPKPKSERKIFSKSKPKDDEPIIEDDTPFNPMD